MRITAILLSLLFICGATALSAQTPRNDSAYMLEAVEVTATKIDLDKRLIPFSVYSISNEQFKTKPVGYFSLVGEMVQDMPGVHVGEFFPWGMSWIQLRGTGNGVNRTVHLVDGLPAYVYQGSTMNSHDIGQVDVLLGPSSALYGNNASGGVVNMLTRRGTADMGFNFEMAYGSRNTFRPHVHFGDAVELSNGTFRYYVSYSGDFSNGYIMQPFEEMMRTYLSSGSTNIFNQQVGNSGIEDNNYRFNYFATRFDWENDEDSSLSLSINYTQRYLHGGQPNLTLVDDSQQLITSVRGQTRIGDWGKLKLAIGYQSFETYCDETTGFTLGAGGTVNFSSTPTNREICVGTGNRKHLPIDLQLDIKPTENDTVTVGFFYSRGWVNPTHNTGINPNNSNYGRLLAKLTFNETQYSFYLQNALTLLDKKLSFLVGLRYDKWIYDNISIYFNPQQPPTKPSAASFQNVAFRSGLKYWINENVGLHAAFGTAYYQNPQNLFTYGRTSNSAYRFENRGLKPERTWMGELGVDFIKPEWGTEAYLTFYYGEIRDVQTPTNLYATGGTTYSIVRNVGLVQIRGVEFSIGQYIVPDVLKLTASVTLNHSRIKEDNNPQNIGNHLSHSPDYVSSINLLFTKPDLFNFSVSYRHTDDRYYNNANDEYVHYHMRNVDVFDAKIWRDWQITDKLSMRTQITGTNLTDLSYEALYTYMAPGRYIEGSVSFTYQY
ncbi:MAG: TonB-dependent receptor [Deltaproteobacteria bacterium]|jgi:iron complex outermembrane receptor protein|nr:TonB-dependent receptor [Deltaproteobacteria bacterium]